MAEILCYNLVRFSTHGKMEVAWFRCQPNSSSSLTATVLEKKKTNRMSVVPNPSEAFTDKEKIVHREGICEDPWRPGLVHGLVLHVWGSTNTLPVETGFAHSVRLRRL